MKLLLYFTYQLRANTGELQIHLDRKDDELLEMKRLLEESQKELEIRNKKKDIIESGMKINLSSE